MSGCYGDFSVDKLEESSTEESKVGGFALLKQITWLSVTGVATPKHKMTEHSVGRQHIFVLIYIDCI